MINLSIKYYATEDDLTWDNLKDKPFGSTVEMIEIFPEQTVVSFEFSDQYDNGLGIYMANVVIDLVPGVTYTVKFNGEFYTATYTDYALGNAGFWGETNTGEPFAHSNGLLGWKAYLGDTVTCGIYEKKETITPIDSKFLPSEISGTVDEFLSTTSTNPVQNKVISQALVGKKLTGNTYTIENQTVTVGDGAEVFNDYSNNRATGTYSHAEGYATWALGNYSHAEGYFTKARGFNAHAEGNQSAANGPGSHAEGYMTQATTNDAHSEGSQTVAAGSASHAEGTGSYAASFSQHAQGKYNVIDATGTYAHIVGNGNSDSDRSNAHTLDWSGNAWFAGDIYTGGTSQQNGTKMIKSTLVSVETTPTSDGVITWIYE